MYYCISFPFSSEDRGRAALAVHEKGRTINFSFVLERLLTAEDKGLAENMGQCSNNLYFYLFLLKSIL